RGVAAEAIAPEKRGQHAKFHALFLLRSRRGSSSSKQAMAMRADADQVYWLARSSARPARRLRSDALRSIETSASAISSAPAAPTTSGSDPAVLATTGVPHAIASTVGSPKPSIRDGCTSAQARL